jgi:hypothetical protein
MERHGKEARLWRLTESGRAIAKGRITAQFADQIANEKQGSLALASAVADRYLRADELDATLMRRAMVHAYHVRRRPY